MQRPTMRITLLPKDTNPYGTIFGGVILSYIDLAGAVEAKQYINRIANEYKLPHSLSLVTVKMDQVIFHRPIHLGDVVNLYGEVTNVGNTSITVHVRVTVEDDSEELVTEAKCIYVHVSNANGAIKPTPIWFASANRRHWSTPKMIESKFEHHYSKDKSYDFWDAINAQESDELYSLGCDLQNLECKILTILNERSKDE